VSPRQQIIDRITDYLLKGGLFNPEAMEHGKVSALLIDCRDVLEQCIHEDDPMPLEVVMWPG
jgi:hypothetical protein